LWWDIHISKALFKLLKLEAIEGVLDIGDRLDSHEQRLRQRNGEGGLHWVWNKRPSQVFTTTRILVEDSFLLQTLKKRLSAIRNGGLWKGGYLAKEVQNHAAQLYMGLPKSVIPVQLRKKVYGQLPNVKIPTYVDCNLSHEQTNPPSELDISGARCLEHKAIELCQSAIAYMFLSLP
jgi:hypothetical protein